MLEPAGYEQDYAQMIKANAYTLRHLAEHLFASRQYYELHELLTGNRAWMDVKAIRQNGDAAYIGEIDLAISGFVDPLSADQVVSLVALLTARQVVNERTIQHNEEDLKILVLLGHIDEALGYARLRSDQRRFDALVTIYQTLYDQGEPRSEILDETLAAAEANANAAWRVRDLCRLGVLFMQAGRNEIAELTIAKAKEAANIASPTNEISENWSLIAATLAQIRHFDEALTVAKDIEVSAFRDDALSVISTELAEAERLEEAQNLAVNIEDVAKQ